MLLSVLVLGKVRTRLTLEEKPSLLLLSPFTLTMIRCRGALLVVCGALKCVMKLVLRRLSVRLR